YATLGHHPITHSAHITTRHNRSIRYKDEVTSSLGRGCGSHLRLLLLTSCGDASLLRLHHLPSWWGCRLHGWHWGDWPCRRPELRRGEQSRRLRNGGLPLRK